MAEKNINIGMGFAQMLQMQQAFMQQFNLIMASLGVELKLEKIDVSPRDNPNAIDFIWRLTCKEPEIGKMIKEELIKQFGE